MTAPHPGTRRARPWRVVLDTNIVVSALLFTRGLAARVRQAWHAGQVLPLASRATIAELVRVLAYPKFRLSADEQTELLADYLPATTVVSVPPPPARRASMQRPARPALSAFGRHRPRARARHR